MTVSYEQWMKVGCSLATLGEDGRPFFHICSQQNQDYNELKTDKLFSDLLKRNYQSVSIGTFFGFAVNMVSESIHKINFRINESNNNSNKSLCCFSAIGRQRCGTDSKSYRSLCRRGKGTSFSNSLLKAFFTLFREQIDAQRNAYEQRRVVNTQNAQRKVSKNESYRRRPNRLLKRRKRKLFLTLQFLCSDWLMSIRNRYLYGGISKCLGFYGGV